MLSLSTASQIGPPILTISNKTNLSVPLQGLRI